MVRIKELRLKKGVTQAELAKTLNVSQNTLSYWESNKYEPDIKSIKKMASFFDVSIDFLLCTINEDFSQSLTDEQRQLLNKYDKLNMEEKDAVKTIIKQLLKPCSKNNNDQQTEETEIYIDYYDLPVSAGSGVYLDGNSRELEKIPVNDITKKANFALRVSGDSMNPEFSDGDTILIKSQPVIEIGELGIFIYENEGYFKKWGGDKLISLNPKYEPIYIKDHESFYCKGKVLGKL